jgi:hypothetical protein
MNDPAQSVRDGRGLFLAVQSNGTTVEPRARMPLPYIEQCINTWRRFIRPIGKGWVDPRQNRAYFGPAGMLCRVRYDSNARGRALTELTVLQTGTSLDVMERVPGVDPGGRQLLQIEGMLQVPLLLEQRAAIEVLGIDWGAVSPASWCTLQSRLAAPMPAPAYAVERHAAHVAGAMPR